MYRHSQPIALRLALPLPGLVKATQETPLQDMPDRG